MAEFLSTRKFSTETLLQYYNEVFSHREKRSVETVDDLSRTAKQAYELLETQPGAEYGQGTWWQAFNSVTYLTDHKLGRSDDARMESAWFGVNQARKIKAANKAVEFATAA